MQNLIDVTQTIVYQKYPNKTVKLTENIYECVWCLKQAQNGLQFVPTVSHILELD